MLIEKKILAILLTSSIFYFTFWLILIGIIGVDNYIVKTASQMHILAVQGIFTMLPYVALSFVIEFFKRRK